mmetsp:Transcript_24046/g.49734  ORF Transcript_24046/g.49734 Transcript_24046/m.49734 type:complete len:285 (-) Transcript_24046:521-1375(-)
MGLKLLVALAAFSGASAFAPSTSVLPSARRSVRASLAMRDSYMAGNWKLNPESLDDAKALAKEVVEASSDMPGESAVFVPFPYLGAVGDVLEGSKVQLGAQDCYIEAKGAYTGAVSMGMLKSTGVKAVLAGHSERRSIFGEDDDTINKKVLTIIESGLDCILCIGETQEEYDMDLNNEVCALQLAKGLQGVSEEMLSKVIIAYEPVWAIGTGKVATPESKCATTQTRMRNVTRASARAAPASPPFPTASLDQSRRACTRTFVHGSPKPTRRRRPRPCAFSTAAQ